MCLQAFSTKEILKRHFKDRFKINGKQRIKVPKEGEYENYKRKIKSLFMNCEDFKSNGKQIQMSFIITDIKNMLLVVVNG